MRYATPIDPETPLSHGHLVEAVRARCNTDFAEPFARAYVEGANTGVFENGWEMDAPFVGRALANVVKPQGTGQEVEPKDEPVYFYVEDGFLGVISEQDRNNVKGLLVGEVLGSAPSDGERVRMVTRSFFTDPQGYGRGPEDATPEPPGAG